MLKAKKNSMYIDVTGVDDMTDRSTLMEEIIRRNCDVDPRIINSLVNKLGRYGDENHKTIEERATQKSFEQLAGKYRTESDPEDVVAHEAIEVIEPDQFGELDDYETSFLTYYADGKLVFDTEDQPVDDDDIPKIIGNEALDRIGEFAPSAVHVRNHNYHKDYEILRVRENWPGNHDDEEDE